MDKTIANGCTRENGKLAFRFKCRVFFRSLFFFVVIFVSSVTGPVRADDGADAAAAISQSDAKGVVANSPPSRRHLVLLGGGGMFGIIYPREVNDYLQLWIREQGDVSAAQEVYTDMVFSYVPRFSLSVSPVPVVALELFAEFGWAFKVLVGGSGEKDVFHFMRMSSGLSVMLHLPVNGGENAFFAGPGVELDMLRFERFRAKTPGWRGTVGYRFYLKKLVADVFGAVLVTRAQSNLVDGVSMELNYTSFLFGATIYGYLKGN